MRDGGHRMTTSEYIAVVQEALDHIGRLDRIAMEQAKQRLDHLTKPKGSLGQLETWLIQAAGIQQTAIAEFDQTHVVVMAGDHGVVEEGVSAYPADVTKQMVLNFLHGGATINALARQAQAQVHVVDIGVKESIDHPLLLARNVRRGTRNFCREQALTLTEVWQALATGVEIGQRVADGGKRVVVLGEMGIGNTTTSAAIFCALTGATVADVVGRGTGIDDATLAHKTNVITRALQMHQPDASDPIDVLSKLGGLEIAGLAGVLLGAATKRAVVIADGLISTVAVLLATRLEPRAVQYVIAGHRSPEPGHDLALRALQLRPVLDLSMRLGEASGGVTALLVLQGAGRVMKEMSTFEEAGVSEGSHLHSVDQPQEIVSADQRLPLSNLSKSQRDKEHVQQVAATLSELSGVGEEPGLVYSQSELEFTQEERAAVYKAIYLRRDIRRFVSTPLPEDALLRILNAGHHGPSVGFMQPWNFILITDPIVKLQLRDIVERERLAASLHFADPKRDEYLRLKVEGILEAPLTICVTNDPTRGGTHVLGRNSIVETDLFSVSCAIENMWLAARTENIALGWVSIYQKPDVQEILRIPPHVTPAGLLTLGYTDEWPQQPILQTSGWRARVPFTEVLYRNHWGIKM